MKILIPLLFLVFFLALLIGGDIYLSKRFAYYFNIEKTRLLYIGFASLITYMIAALIIFTNSTIGISSFFYGSASIIMGLLLYLLLSTITIDLLNLIIKMPPKLHGVIILSMTVLISGYGIWNAGQLRVTERNVELKGLNESVKAVHLSDIHLGHFRGQNFLQRLVDKTNQQNPDVVFITGDLFDGKINLKEDVLKPLKDIKVPVYFVEGNHDIYTDVKTIKKYLKNIGVHVLENELIKHGSLQIIGLNHMRPNENSPEMHAQKGNTIKDVMQTLVVEDDLPSILLHHSPDGIIYAYDKGIDLFLSGHTHSGQLFPGNLIVGLVYKYSSGEYNYEDMKILVSEGVGTWGPPMRVGTKSELIVLNLIKK